MKVPPRLRVFTLRFCSFVVLVISVCFAYMNYRAMIQKRSVNQILAIGGEVCYEDERCFLGDVLKTSPRKFRDFRFSVVEAAIPSTGFSPEIENAISNLQHLQTVYVTGGPESGATTTKVSDSFPFLVVINVYEKLNLQLGDVKLGKVPFKTEAEQREQGKQRAEKTKQE